MRLLQRALGFVAAIVLLAAALVYASLILAIAAALAIVIGTWLWWRSRELRRQVRGAAERGEGVVVEGEYRIERERLDDRP
ncbi:MAG TPA: hypothetical protein VMI15_00935 [Burkholderiales bacterium]|nr:hypothetical protein [Burkholderiales bacterium]